MRLQVSAMVRRANAAQFRPRMTRRAWRRFGFGALLAGPSPLSSLWLGSCSKERLACSSLLTYGQWPRGASTRYDVLTPPRWSKCMLPRLGGAAVSTFGRSHSLSWLAAGLPHIFLHLASARRMRLARPLDGRLFPLGSGHCSEHLLD